MIKQSFAKVMGDSSLAKSIWAKLGEDGFCQDEGFALNAFVYVDSSAVLPPIQDCTFEEWRTLLNANLDSPIFAVQEVFARMVELGEQDDARRIVFVIDSGSPASWGIRGFARHLAFELAPTGILVNVVLYDSHDVQHDGVAEIVSFLVSDDAANVTGMTLPVGNIALLV